MFSFLSKYCLIISCIGCFVFVSGCNIGLLETPESRGLTSEVVYHPKVLKDSSLVAQDVPITVLTHERIEAITTETWRYPSTGDTEDSTAMLTRRVFFTEASTASPRPVSIILWCHGTELSRSRSPSNWSTKRY